MLIVMMVSAVSLYDGILSFTQICDPAGSLVTLLYLYLRIYFRIHTVIYTVILLGVDKHRLPRRVHSLSILHCIVHFRYYVITQPTYDGPF